MSSLIEKAAQRLEQLRKAGAEVPTTSDLPPLPPLNTRHDAAHPRPLSAEPARPAVTSRVVELDLDVLSAAGIITPNAQRSPTADQFRVLKRPLLANATGKGAVPVRNGNRIMVTSSMPGEGKTFTAVNLAMSIAMELDHTVLLVDADVSRPSVMKTLGLPSGPGLMDLLMGEQLEMSEALLRTNIDKLSLLPSGRPHARATELLASDAMSALVEEMGRRYPERVIVFDSPPLLMTTESRVLATHMGQIVVVVQAGHTQRAQVRQALETIESCPIKLMVLNQVHKEDKSSYGYGYGYSAAPSSASA
ncbi:MAG: tyrosine-protein kinase family protein [Hydrogenophaga sp.]|uniref:non-specific protein-tyrosine kinase n=1 Tax=Hydrogenophaga crocea TaxID=2716225 RepID=A0A6G8IFB6_9BURK|nr:MULTISPECIES: XrtA-associated tyrosine autokinase [Hydrogenophaga]MBL0945290.1 tyrosine-protein kinase family protein [Hydrogenophaga sp.]QIM51862.1 tyrosine-protein kinase family protein [Hydrogenophaga crocea]